MKRFIAVLLLVLLVSGCAPTTQNDSATIRALQQRINNLENQLQGNNSLGGASSVSTGNPKDLKNWRSLKNGMTEAQVLRLLGEPEKVSNYGSFYQWKYHDFSYVSFWIDYGSTVGKVNGWNEPY